MFDLTKRSTSLLFCALAIALSGSAARADTIAPLQKQPAPNPSQAQTIENITPGVWLEPRFGVQFTTGPGSGYSSSFGTFSSWLPLFQDGVSNLIYAEGLAQIDTDDGLWAGNIAFGYRNFTSDVVLGGYVGYDVQDVGSFTAHQIGLGLEALHPGWEARLNGYLPVGDRSQTVSDTSTTTSQSLINPRFSGNQLLVTPQSTIQQTVIADNSLAGFDLEGGATLSRWSSGKLQGFVGSYLYGGPNTDAFVGFRSRLLAEVANFSLGAALETDGVFGTNLSFTVGANFGGGARSAGDPTDLSALLGKPLARQKRIAIHRSTETTTTITTGTETAALNPNTTDPNDAEWNFTHVDLNNGSSTGSSEADSPLSTIAEGITEANDTPDNDVIYVQGTGSEAGFTIPQNTRVLSSGPSQTLAVTADNITSTVTLPNSGTGNFPELTSDVDFSSTSHDRGSELNGFAFNGPKITVANLTGTVEIENNRMNNSTARGIYFDHSSGTLNLTISGNTINNSTDDAIRGDVGVTTGTNGAIVNATITNNQIDGTTSTAGVVLPNAEGIDLEVRGTSQINATITGNTISNTDNSGIELEAYEAGVILNATITGNTISNTGGDGILFLHYSDINLDLTISNNTITGTGANQSGVTKTIASDTFTLLGMSTTANVEVEIGAGGFGISVLTLSDGNLALTVESNNISNTADAKIGIGANPIFLYTADTITTSQGGVPLGALADGIAANQLQTRFAGMSRIDANIRLNSLTGTGAGIKDLSAFTNLANYDTGGFGALVGSNGTVCVNLENNTATNVGGAVQSGYQFVSNNSSSGGTTTPTLIRGTTTGNTGAIVTTQGQGTVTNGTCN